MSFRRNVLSALLSQGISFLAMACASLFIPRFLGVTEFGYWQLFLLYSGYVGVAHLGINDGVYLRLGGVHRDDVPKHQVAGEFWLVVIFQTLISILMVVLSMALVSDGLRLYVMFGTALYLLLSNVTNFIGYLFQAMNETILYSTSIMINRGLYLVSIIFSLIIGVDDCRILIAIYIACQGISLVYCLFHYQDFLICGLPPFRESLDITKSDMQSGSKLMVANFASSFVLNVSKFAIDARWGINVFSVVSFALTLGTFFLSFVNQVAMVLFPTLRGFDAKGLRTQYYRLRNLLGCALPIMYLAYFPLSLIIFWWLPEYKSSVDMLPLILPICMFDTKMSILSNTFYKVTRKENILLLFNVIACAVSVLGCAVGMFIANNPIVVVASSVVAIVARSIMSDLYQSRIYEFSASRSMCIELVFTIVFCLSALCLDSTAAFLVVVVTYVLYLYLNPEYRKELLLLIKKDSVNK